MPDYDFSNVEDLNPFTSIPPGRYFCELADIRVTRRPEGHDRWGLRWNVSAGDFAGRFAAWDGLIFSERGMPRVKFVFRRLGFDVEGPLSLEPGELIGSKAWVTIVHEEYLHEATGERRISASVAYAGYESADRDEPPAAPAAGAPF